MLEKELEAKVVKYAKDHGILTYKFVSPNNRGVPDRIFLKDGYTLFIEFKSPRGQCTELQKREHQRIWDVGHKVFVVHDYEAAVELLHIYLPFS